MNFIEEKDRKKISMSAPKPEEKSKEKPKGGDKAEKKASAKAGSDPVQSLGSKIAMIGKLKSK